MNRTMAVAAATGKKSNHGFSCQNTDLTFDQSDSDFLVDFKCFSSQSQQSIAVVTAVGTRFLHFASTNQEEDTSKKRFRLPMTKYPKWKIIITNQCTSARRGADRRRARCPDNDDLWFLIFDLSCIIEVLKTGTRFPQSLRRVRNNDDESQERDSEATVAPNYSTQSITNNQCTQ